MFTDKYRRLYFSNDVIKQVLLKVNLSSTQSAVAATAPSFSPSFPVLEFLNNLWVIGIGLSYRPARLHSLAELVPWNRFLGSLKVSKFGLRCCHAPESKGCGVQAASSGEGVPLGRTGGTVRISGPGTIAAPHHQLQVETIEEEKCCIYHRRASCSFTVLLLS
jgi:hypothetical protein